jgi:hypothetical protein
MSEDAGAAAEGQGGAAPAGEGPAAQPQGAAPAGAPLASAEDMLADAVSRPDGDADNEDPQAVIRRLESERDKWKNTTLKAEARANQNSDAAKRLKTLEDAQKTEVQRATEAQQAAEARAAEAEGRYHRTLAAATYGLPPSLIDMITGTTEDEITASAETLAAEINARVAEQVAAQVAAASAAAAAGTPGPSQPTAAAAAAAARGRRPVESMRAGAAPSNGSGGSPANGNEWMRSLYGELHSAR